MVKKVLIFDDEEAIRMLYEDELSDEGYDVISSGDASRCIDLIREHGPNVVVMDRKMGKHDGLEVLRKIRDRFPALPLVLCTAYSSNGPADDSGIVDFHATKTSDMKDLKEKISAAIALWEVKHVS